MLRLQDQNVKNQADGWIQSFRVRRAGLLLPLTWPRLLLSTEKDGVLDRLRPDLANVSTHCEVGFPLTSSSRFQPEYRCRHRVLRRGRAALETVVGFPRVEGAELAHVVPPVAAQPPRALRADDHQQIVRGRSVSVSLTCFCHDRASAVRKRLALCMASLAVHLVGRFAVSNDLFACNQPLSCLASQRRVAGCAAAADESAWRWSDDGARAPRHPHRGP